MSRSESNSPHQGSLRINPYYTFGTPGIMLYAAWLFLQYTHPVLLLEDVSFAATGVRIGNGSLIIFVAVAIVALVLAWLLTDKLNTRRGRTALLVFAVAGGPLPCLAPVLWLQGTTATTALAVACWLFAPLAYAALLLLWSTLLVTLGGRRVIAFMAAVVLAGAAAFVFIALLLPVPRPYFIASLPVCSALLFMLSFRNRQSALGHERTHLAFFAHDSDERNPITWRTIADTLTYTPCLGIALYCALWFMPYPANLVGIGIASILSCALVMLDTRYRELLSSKMQLRLFVPLAALTVIPLGFTQGTLQMVLCVLVFAVFMLSLATNYAAISECVRVFELSPLRVFSYGRAYNLAGVLAGYLFALMAFSDSFVQNGWTIYAFYAVLLVFIFLATFVVEDSYPTSSEVSDAEESAPVPPSFNRDFWVERCESLASRYGLSQRQTEVLILLAMGRNTTYIQESLVISSHTAKAHIYNTYQKLGIHSRQDLLTLIESVDVTQFSK
jgi:DNA-binding CsgD family transcriptional regulator/MFS family permease